MKNLLYVYLAAITMGCAHTTQLPAFTPDNVQILPNMPNPEAWRYLGDVDFTWELKGIGLEKGMRICKDELKRQAFDKGGSMIVISLQNYGCDDCISIWGSVYRPRPRK